VLDVISNISSESKPKLDPDQVQEQKLESGDDNLSVPTLADEIEREKEQHHRHLIDIIIDVVDKVSSVDKIKTELKKRVRPTDYQLVLKMYDDSFVDTDSSCLEQVYLEQSFVRTENKSVNSQSDRVPDQPTDIYPVVEQLNDHDNQIEVSDAGKSPISYNSDRSGNNPESDHDSPDNLDQEVKKRYGEDLDQKVEKIYKENSDQRSEEDKPEAIDKQENTKDMSNHSEDGTSNQEDDTSDQEDDTSDQEDHISDQEDDTSDQENDTSDKEDNTSDKEDNTSDKEDNTSDKEDDTSDKKDDTSDYGNNTSDKEDDTNDKEDDTSDYGNNTSDKEDDISDQEDSTSDQGDGDEGRDNSIIETVENSKRVKEILDREVQYNPEESDQVETEKSDETDIQVSNRPDPTLNGRIPPPDSKIWDEIPFLFLHIPKTAGTSISSQLQANTSYWHLFPDYYPSRIRTKIVTIVRNPYDRAVSAFFFFKEGGIWGNEEWCKELIKSYSTFEEWVMYGINQDMLYDHTQHKLPNPTYPMMLQTEWLLTNTRPGLYVLLDNIGRYETLQQDVKRLMNINLKQHLQSSSHDDWRTYYKDKPEVQNKIYQLYKRDFDMLNYAKEIN